MPLYNVAPLPKNVAITAGQTASAEGLEITAAAITKDEDAFARFDANLPLAGILAIDIKINNRSPQEIRALTFAARDARGQQLTRLEPRKVLDALMDFEGVQLYALEGKKQTREQLEAIGLPKKLSLAAQEEKRGLLFFRAGRDLAQFQSLILEVKSSKQIISLPLL